MRVAVHGASGFVGGLVVARLRDVGVEPVLVGRRALPGFRVAAVDDHESLVRALADVDVVINCASPFTHFGEPVIRAAIDAGVAYVDVSGEESYIKGVLDRHASAPVPILPAANNDCLTGDLLGHLVAEGLGGLETISTAFTAVDAEGSRGTVLMALTTRETFHSGGLTWEDGEYVRDRAAKRTSVAWPSGDAPAVKFPLPPAVTLPRHVRTRHSEGLASPEIQAFFAGATQATVDGTPRHPTPDSRSRARFTLVVDALATDGARRQGVLEGRDMYGTTAVIAVEAARRLLAAPPGAHAAAEVLDPADFLTGLAAHGVTWRVA
ncbi:saccharopine dehydrogenase NADP-binding domain-containing protein [Saccharothrix hoggarensis]|uniref:Saccharopine dehydrogenase NADP-binding domain-containing protein n=1 Tax=Saccharothrix hoggarensis TaxID=913853 RepID=A0ABW3R331_9PSEU